MSNATLERPRSASSSAQLPAAPKRVVGEAKVWLTSVGLTLGLLMVVGLLGVILDHGVRVFWPRRLVQIEIRSGSPFEFQGKKVIAGAVVSRSEKMSLDAAARAAALASGRAPMEWQLYVGNKDAWGQNFVFVDAEAVAGESYPRDLFLMERVEYGNAIGTPLALKSREGAIINVGDAGFHDRLNALTREVNARRAAIKRLEKVEIGDINARMERIKLDEKALGNSASARAAALEAELKTLQAKYETLAAKAAALREQEADWTLTYRLPGGDERTIPLGQLMSFYYPNQLTFPQRVGWFVRNLWVFLTAEPREANTEGGIFPAIFGTFVMTLLMSVAVVPFGVLAAIYLREYARQGFAVRAVRIAVNNLAGVPSIVFGVFGLGFFVYVVGGSIDSWFFPARLPTPTFGTGGILWAAATLALMTVPVVIVATEEAISAVPRGMREASLACGASKWQTIEHIILPSAIPGILTGLILAMARGAGEVAPLMLVGVVKLAPSLPLDTVAPFIHLDRKFMHLGFHIYDLGFQSPDSEAAKPMVYATTLLLIVLVISLNLGAILIRERLRRKYRTGAF
jgi:phosphate transport system permease protein